MTMYGYIYIITNCATDKIYIGCTIMDIERRWRGHLGAVRDGSQTHLCRAIRKYGAGRFTIEGIDAIATKQEMYSKERQYIAAMDTLKSGMNMTEGGDGSIGWKHSKETKALKSEQMKGNKNLVGHKHSEETKRKIGAAMKGNTHLRGHKYPPEYCQAISTRTRGEKNYMYGKSHTDETKRKISIAQIGKVLPESQKRNISAGLGRYYLAQRKKGLMI